MLQQALKPVAADMAQLATAFVSSAAFVLPVLLLLSSWWCPCAARPRGPVLVGAVFLSLLHIADVGAAVAAVGARLVLTASLCGKEGSYFPKLILFFVEFQNSR